MSSVATEQTGTMRDLTSVVDALRLPMLLPGGLRASVPNALNDFPSLSWASGRGWGHRERVKPKLRKALGVLHLTRSHSYPTTS